MRTGEEVNDWKGVNGVSEWERVNQNDDVDKTFANLPCVYEEPNEGNQKGQQRDNACGERCVESLLCRSHPGNAPKYTRRGDVHQCHAVGWGEERQVPGGRFRPPARSKLLHSPHEW